MTVMLVRGPVMVVTLSLLISACDTGCTSSPTPTVPPPSDSLRPASPAPRTTVGTIEDVAFQTGYVDDKAAGRDDPVYMMSSVSTDGSGAVRFDVTDKIKSCTLSPSTKVEVEPGNGVVLKYFSGTTTCATAKGSGVIILEAGGQTRITMSDPLFVVTVNPESTTVRVVMGLVEVRNVATGNDLPIYVGPNLEADVFPDRDPGPPVIFHREELPPPALNAVNLDLQFAPPPLRRLPDPSNSFMLRRIKATTSFIVGIDERIATDPRSKSFVESIRKAQSERWAVLSDSITLRRDEGIRSLLDNKIAMFISPDPRPGVVDQLPLFLEPGREGDPIWLLTDQDDKIFASAERAFLEDIVNSGRYAGLYVQAFDQQPKYSAVADLFGLR